MSKVTNVELHSEGVKRICGLHCLGLRWDLGAQESNRASGDHLIVVRK